ncbi:MAG TPA: aspartate aminotransferase family protein [Acidimicrobiales bacterium]|nr:aspartate aminotransferase family protein [Acidimicrobiales bacterium]
MPFDVDAAFREHQGDQFALHEAHLNPQLPRVLRTLGFDRTYVRGEGPWLFDDRGERYLDLLSGFGVFALGRSHPAIKAALRQAIELDLPNMVQMDCALFPGLLAEALCARSAEQLERVYFCNSGAEAVESAVKFARAFTKRSRIVYCAHGYHGLTLGALSLNGGTAFRAGFGPLLADVTEVPFGDLDALRAALADGDVAAFVAEPIQGKGVYEAPVEYWREAEQACRVAGALLVMDEVQTGIARTGTFWCYEQFGLTPDVVCASKALSGGYVPVACVLARDDVFRSVYSSMDRALVHSTTFKQNQLAMVAGLATLSVIDDEGLVEHAHKMGDVWKARFAPLLERYELLTDVRGKGQMVGLEFGEPQSRRLRRWWRLAERIRPAYFAQTIVLPLFRRHRILTQVAADGVNIIKLLPSLGVGEEEIDLVVAAFDDVLADAHRAGGNLFETTAALARGSVRRPPRRHAAVVAR